MFHLCPDWKYHVRPQDESRVLSLKILIALKILSLSFPPNGRFTFFASRNGIQIVSYWLPSFCFLATSYLILSAFQNSQFICIFAFVLGKFSVVFLCVVNFSVAMYWMLLQWVNIGIRGQLARWFYWFKFSCYRCLHLLAHFYICVLKIQKAKERKLVICISLTLSLLTSWCISEMCFLQIF